MSTCIAASARRRRANMTCGNGMLRSNGCCVTTTALIIDHSGMCCRAIMAGSNGVRCSNAMQCRNGLRCSHYDVNYGPYGMCCRTIRGGSNGMMCSMGMMSNHVLLDSYDFR